MKKFIIKSFVFIFLIGIYGCNTYRTVVDDKETNIVVKFPKNTVETDTTLLISGSYSNKFSYKNDNYVTALLDNNFTINDSVIVGFNIKKLSSSGILNVEQLKERRNTLIFLTRQVSDNSEGFPKYVDKKINGNNYFLQFYKVKNNKKDYFVDFESEMSQPNVIRGRIRFPASYSLQRIEKETYKILKGIKFGKVK